MASKIICDVCGKECKENAGDGRYELKYKCFIRVAKVDICYDCFKEIKKAIKNKQVR